MKPNEKNYIFQQIAQRFKQHPRFWDELQTQQYLFFANLNFVAMQFQQNNLTFLRFLEEFESNSIDTIYSSLLQFKNKTLQRMQFNKWVVLTIEYMIQQEENQGISMTNITSQTNYTTTFEDLQIIKEEKNTTSSLGTLSFNHLQQESRPLNTLLQRISSIITQDLINSSKQNTNIPEEREDEFEDDSVDGEEEDDESDEYEEEREINVSHRAENEEGIRSNNLMQRQSQDLQEQVQHNGNQQEQQSKENNSQERGQDIEFKEKQQEEEKSKQEIRDGQNDKEQNAQILNKTIVNEHSENKKDYEKSRSNSNSSDVCQQTPDQQQDSQQSNGNVRSNSSSIMTVTQINISRKIFEQKRCSFDVDIQDTAASGDNAKVKQKIKRKSRNSTQSEHCEEGSNLSIQMKEKSKKSIVSGIDIDSTGGFNEEECYRSSKSLKRRSEDKNNINQDSQDGSKSKHYTHHNRKQHRMNHIAKIDDEMEYQIVEEVQKVCLVLKDKQLIQWDKNELQNIAIKFKYFQELGEIIEQNDIDGFALFIIINEELQLHDLPRFLNISFSSASKLKSFIQILEPLRSEQMIKIAKKKKYARLTHQSSIEGDFVIESPELKSKNSNVYQQSNSKYIQSLIGMSFQQVPTISQMGNSQKISFSAFYGGNSLKTSSKFNTYDQLQDSSEYEEQKIQGNNGKNIKNNNNPIHQAEKGSSQIFEIQTREKLLSSASDHDTQNQNFKASTDQSKVPFKISEDKPQSNNTIVFNESQPMWNYSKSKSPNLNRLTKTAFHSQLSASQNRTNLGLSSHFTSVDNASSYDDRRNINSQPTLGTSFHFDRQSIGMSAQNTTPATAKIPDDDNCANSAITTAVTAGMDSKDESGLQQNSNHNHNHHHHHPHHHGLKNLSLYPSKSTQLPQHKSNNHQESQYISSESQLETPTPINDSQNLRIHSAQIQSSSNIIDEQDKGTNQQNKSNKNAQENTLGDSSYISQPLGISQKVEKQHVQGSDSENPRPIRKVSSNNTLFQSMDQQQPTQISQIVSTNLVNSQQLSNSQPQSDFQNQQTFFTQSDNFDQSIKFKGITKGQSQDTSLKFQVSQQKPQLPNQQSQQNSLKAIQSNPSINNIASPIMQSNQPGSNTSYTELNQLDMQQQQQIRQLSFQPNTPSFFPIINQQNSRSSLTNGGNTSLLNLNQQYSQKTTHRVSFDNSDVYQLKFQPESILGDNPNSNKQIFQNSQQNIFNYQQQSQNSQNQQQNIVQQDYNHQGSEKQASPPETEQNNQFLKDPNYSLGNSMLSNQQQQNAQNPIIISNSSQQIQNQGNYQLAQPLSSPSQQQQQLQENGNSLKFNYGNSIPSMNYNQKFQQTAQPNPQIQNNNGYVINNNIPSNYQNYPQEIQNQQPKQQSIQEIQPEANPDKFMMGNSIPSVQILSSRANIDQQQQQQSQSQLQVPYQQGSSFICYNNGNMIYPNQMYNQNTMLPQQQPIQQQQPAQYQNQNQMQGNSIAFQQYPPQQQHFNQDQQQYQGNQLPFLQNPQQDQYQYQSEIHKDQPQQNNANIYNQGASIYYTQGQQMYQQQNQQNQQQQQNNYGSSYIGTNQMNQGQQNFLNYNNYYNPNQQQMMPQQQPVDPTQIFNYNHHFHDNQQIQGNQYDLNNNNNNYYYNNDQQYYQNQFNQNNGQQFGQRNSGDSQIGLKLPNIFLMNINNSAHEDLLINSPDVAQNTQAGDNSIIQTPTPESISKNIQHQKMLKLQQKQNQVLKCTYNLPFNPFKFEVIPTIKVDIKSKNSDQHIMYYTFHSEGATIGRNINNSINFLEEQTISAFHAIIFSQKKEFYIQDIKSKAGTFIKIKSIPITSNLKLKLGEVEIKIVKVEDGIISFQTSSQTNRKGTINMNQKSEFILGRCRLRCDFPLTDVGNTVSYLHAKIHYNDKKEICISDLDSGNGTWLRLSEKSCRSNPYKLSLNDQIMISNTKKIVVIELNT